MPAIEALGDGNYSTWGIQMKALLVREKVWKFAKDGIAADASEEDLEKDEQALAALQLNVAKHLLNSIANCKTSKEAWDLLASTYKSKMQARIVTLRTDLSQLRQLPAESVEAFSSRTRTLFDELTAAGHATQESDVIIQLLVGLLPEFKTVITFLKHTRALTFAEVIPTLLDEEQSLKREDANAIALLTRQRPSGNASNNSRRDGLFCTYCKKKGHTEERCFKLHPELAPPWFKGGRGAQAQAQGGRQADGPALALVAVSSLGSGLEPQPGLWVLDTGATRHITPHFELFSNLRPDSTSLVFGNDETTTAIGVGDVEFFTTCDGRESRIVLKNVLYVPGAHASLLSVDQATQAGADFRFSAVSAEIVFNGAVQARATRGNQKGLYLINATYKRELAMFAAVKETPELWHRRLGHLGADSLLQLVKDNMVTGISIKAADITLPFCEPCILGKQTRLPFSESTTKTERPLELVHMDVCGPFQVPSLGGSVYMATFLDDFTGFSAVHPIVLKSHVGALIKRVFIQWENQLSTPEQKFTVKAVRTDNGGEYVNADLTAYFQSKGVVHQKTAPYTPEQNGKAERLNRTIVERVRTMLAETDLSKSLWAEAANTVNFLRNISPNLDRALTPWEAFYGTKPDVSGLRVWGCVAYCHTPKTLRQKLDPVSKRGRFVGYANGSKAYRIMLDTGTFVISRDVTFSESDCKFEALESGPQNGEAAESFVSPAVASRATAVAPVATPAQTSAVPVPIEPVQAAPAPFEAPSIAVEGSQRRSDRLRGLAPAASTMPSSFAKFDRRVPDEVLYTAEEELRSEPTSCEEAMNAPDAMMWKAAMEEEIASLLSFGTWDLELLPFGSKALPCKWVFKIKRDALGNIERYKARLVAKGFAQREGVDFSEVFAPVSKHTTFRTLLSIVASDDLELHQVDVTTAFLNGELEEDIFMKQPPGFETGPPGTVCHLRRSLYGLRQAPRAWYTKLTAVLEEMGFVASVADPGLFILINIAGTSYMLVWVDDLLIATQTKETVASVLSALRAAFDIRDLGDAHVFIGMHITRDRAKRTLKLDQSKMTAELVKKWGMAECKSRTTPLNPGTVLNSEEPNLDQEQFNYCELVGSLLYLSVCTRPDISQAVGALSRYMSKPSTTHWTAATGVLRYLAGKIDLGITFSGPSPLVGYCDADFGGDKETRRSTTGYVFMLNGGAISWCSRLQPTVAVSTTEAEYMAASMATKEALWLSKLLSDFGRRPGVLNMLSDNQATIKLLENPVVSNRSKHIDVIHYFARERVARGEVSFKYVSTDFNWADIMTKPVTQSKFEFCIASMGLTS